MTFVRPSVKSDLPKLAKRLMKTCQENNSSAIHALHSLGDDDLRRLYHHLKYGERKEKAGKVAKLIGFYALIVAIFGMIGEGWRIVESLDPNTEISDYAPDIHVDNRLARGVVAYEMILRGRLNLLPTLIEMMPEVAYGTQERIWLSLAEILSPLTPEDRPFFQAESQSPLVQLALSDRGLAASQVETMRVILGSLRDFGDEEALACLLKIGGGQGVGKFDALREIARNACQTLRVRLNQEDASRELLRPSSPDRNDCGELLTPAAASGASPSEELLRSSDSHPSRNGRK